MWATALYAGLRRGELAALRWLDVDFERGLIRVERSWEPKSRSGRRRVPMARPLKAHLAAHRLLAPGPPDTRSGLGCEFTRQAPILPGHLGAGRRDRRLAHHRVRRFLVESETAQHVRRGRLDLSHQQGRRELLLRW